ncbi:MAG: hypothetical protein HUJ86_00640 [Synergistes sp.]|nr:hypothetical protein [Synergistes sp.]
MIGLGIGSRWGDRPWFYRPRPMVQVNNRWNYSWREYVPSWDYDFWPDDPDWYDLAPWSDFDPWYDGGYYDPASSDLDLIAPQTDVIDDSDDEEVIIVPQEELPSHMEYEYVPNNDPMFGPDSQPLPESMAGPEPMPGFEPALGPEPMPELEDDYGGDDYGGWD